jgi:DNA-binding NarL/FixJ family response regulator
MPALSGIGAVKEIARVSPQTRSILLTMYTEEHHILDALRAGVRGCVSKTQAAEHLLEAIRAVQAGDVYLSPSVSGAIVQAYLAKADPTPDPLTGRERQVLHLIAEGKTTKEIAGILGVTPKTVETHRAKLMEKLDIHGTAGLVRYAIRQGLLQP